MPYRPLVPPQPKSAIQIEAEQAKKENDALWNAPHKPGGKKIFNSPKKDATEMTRHELENAWSARAFTVVKGEE